MLVLSVFLTLGCDRGAAPEPATGSVRDSIATASADRAAYRNDSLAIAFDYPRTLFLAERVEPDGAGGARLVLTLVEDTPEHRALLAGEVTDAREFPPAITITVVPNPRALSPEQFAESLDERRVATGAVSPVMVGSARGVGFDWDGLYGGRTVVLADSRRGYLLSVTDLARDGRTWQAWEALLPRVRVGAAEGGGS